MSASVNAHTHLYSGLVPLGMPPAEPPPETFVQILERVWWRLDRALDEQTLAAAARYAVAHALLHGTAGLIDHHESPGMIEGSLDVLADVCAELGMPSVLCYGASERNGGPEEARRGLAECRRFVESNRRPLLRGVVGLHASFTVSDETLLAAGRLARELDTVVHVHLAEDRADIDHARSLGHVHPLQRLLAADALPPGSILAHGVHLGPDEVALCNDHGLWLVHNPRSNEGNRVGWAAALHGVQRVALGTDGWESDLDAEAAAGRRLAAPGQVDDIERRRAAGTALLAERFGDQGAPSVVAGPGRLTIAGVPLVEGGRLLRADLDALEAEARRQAARLWQRMAALS